MEGTPGQHLDFEGRGPWRFRGAFFSFWRPDRLLEVLYVARRLAGRERLSLLLGHSRLVSVLTTSDQNGFDREVSGMRLARAPGTTFLSEDQ